MGCGGSKNSGLDTIERPRTALKSQGNKIAVWGDYFDVETRTLLAILQMTDTPYIFNELDTLKEEHMKEPYFSENPTGNIPMMIQGQFKVIGESGISIGFLASTNSRIRDELLPAEVMRESETLLAWYQGRLKPIAERLTSAITKSKQNYNTSRKNAKKELKDILKYHFPILEKRLQA